jgi:hypothetical protein
LGERRLGERRLGERRLGERRLGERSGAAGLLRGSSRGWIGARWLRIFELRARRRGFLHVAVFAPLAGLLEAEDLGLGLLQGAGEALFVEA